MGVKQLIRKAAKFVLASSPETTVKVKVAQVRAGNVLAGKNIIVTGGGKGLGYAMAKKFVSEGANVIISGRNKSTLEKAAKELGSKCSYMVFDISEAEKAKQFLVSAKEKFGGKLDILVNNAGVSMHENNFRNVTVDSFDKQFNTNMKGTYFMSKAFLEIKLEEKNPSGQLLMISSETGDQCYDIPYGLTKASINSLTRALSRRVYKSGIRVNAIAPGVTLSDMTKEYADASDGNMYRDCASDRIFLPEEVAEVACFLLSDASKCISGEIIHCNAGNHLNPFWEA